MLKGENRTILEKFRRFTFLTPNIFIYAYFKSPQLLYFAPHFSSFAFLIVPGFFLLSISSTISSSEIRNISVLA